MTDKQLREQIRPLADEILRVGARLYRDKNWLGGRAEVDEQLDAIMQAVKTYGAYKWADGFNNGMDEAKSNALYFLSTGRKTIRIADLDTVFGTTPPELTNTGDTSV